MVVSARHRQIILGCAVVSALSLLALGVALAQQPGAVLHEYFAIPTDDTALRRGMASQDARSAASDRDAQLSRLPSRGPGSPPALSLATSQNEPILSESGPRSALPFETPQGGLDPLTAENRLDQDTDRVDELNYFASFDPSVIPYKRGVSQNAVRMDSGDYIFTVQGGRPQRVPLEGGEPTPLEDVFWGTFLVRAQPGVSLPIPSVAADQRLLEVATEPPAPLTLYRDRADNYSIVVEHEGIVRVNLRLAAPRSYFIGELRETTWDSFEREHVSVLPNVARRVAREMSQTMGLDPSRQTPREVLMALIAYFRDFEAIALPESLRGQDNYRAIMTAQLGVCRHRSFAFVITASALGIPARYVYNEAHAFVEVRWPGVGWRRVDLGGAAQDVLMRAAEAQQRVHDTGESDSLPQPPAYLQEIERMREQQRGQNGGAGETQGGASSSAADRAARGQGDNGGFEVPDGPMNALDEGQDGPFYPPPDGSSSPTGVTDSTKTPSREVRPPRRAVVAQVSRAPTALRRGESFVMSGVLQGSDGAPIANREVRVMLSPPGALGAGVNPSGKVLATTRTDAQGRFEAQAQLPAQTPIGRWALRAVFPGDAELEPAASP